MSELSKDELLGQVETWLIACKHDAEGVYENCKECPCKKSCKQAKRKIMALIKKEVTEEWIWKAIEYIKEYPSYHRLEEKLKEAGVEIKK